MSDRPMHGQAVQQVRQSADCAGQGQRDGQ